MDSPFYGNYWSHPAHPRYSSNMRGIPVQSIHHQPTEIKPTPKVVRIPVHFVGSEKPEPDRSGSALRIQKVFRGYLVRKSVKKILSIRKEVEDIEQKLLCSEKAEFIRKDEKERLRVNETLMSLLFKLDSIRGVDYGVRELRKGVIRKAIYLQEKIDSIVSTNQSDPMEQTVDVDNQAAASNYTTNDVESVHSVERSIVKCEELQEKSTNQSDVYDPIEQSMDQGEPNYTTNDEKSTVKEECIEGVNDDENETRELEESIRNRELLEKMVEKNEKMVRMMNELCQRNEVQTKTLNSLTQRVDQLEKAFICDRLKTKKKKKNRHPA
ncbi:uncharacterized protein LOC132052525 [Lycium ferocissimum]|uniref:uncharacterized protein LOC132052525 n=1 Tax=Lycium ferocissimum TaxID=112874 RepID=UPI0028153A50|nr:uncharacterized protein LOC132052525 [Lycium ferocissimum]